LGDCAAEHLADAGADRAGDHHGNERRSSWARYHGRTMSDTSTAISAVAAKASVSFKRRAMEIFESKMRRQGPPPGPPAKSESRTQLMPARLSVCG
jgi:hypothetical protein